MARGRRGRRCAVNERPVYTIRIAAQLVGVHQQTLRTYEREGLLVPARSAGRQRLYSEADIERLLLIRRLIEELGVNLAGADIILRLRRQLDELEAENRRLKRELRALQRVRDQRLPSVTEPPPATEPPAPSETRRERRARFLHQTERDHSQRRGRQP